MTELKNLQELGRHMEFEATFLEPKYGEIYYVDLINMPLGNQHVVGKSRPGLIISNNKGNTFGSTIIVAFLTTVKPNSKLYPFQYRVELNGKDSLVMFEQIATIDKTRLLSKAGELTPKQLKEAEKRLMYSLALQRFSLENIKDIDIINRINVKTKTEDYIGFTIQLLFIDNEPLEVKIKLEKLQELDKDIHSEISFDELKKKLDCCRGLNWLVCNNEL